MKQYNPKEIESKWQEIWQKTDLYQTPENPDNPFYCLVMLPYTSGDLHIGHWYNFGPSDTIARFRRMQGKDVFHPIGFDAFGLPAENAAIKRDVSPADWTEQNMENMTQQLKRIGAMYDWDKSLATCDPSYYRWTQWLFLLLYQNDLAYRAGGLQNWCPSCETVLANEQVVGEDNLCERCDTPVEKKELDQWFFKITEYQQELLDSLDGLDWSKQVKTMQRNWIGKSEGAEITFPIVEPRPSKVVLMHGKDADSSQKWYPKLQQAVEDNDIDFQAPDLPGADGPILEEWLEELKNISPDQDTILIGHSRGGMAALRYLEQAPKDLQVGRVILLSTNRGHVPDKTGGSFYGEEYDFEKIKTHCSDFIVFHSRDDKYVPFEAGEHLAEGLDAELITYNDLDHFGSVMLEDKDKTELFLSDLENRVFPSLKVFTTRPDTLYGATYMVLAPEHSLVDELTTEEQQTEAEEYVHQAKQKSEQDRLDAELEKTGVFTGSYAVNPVTEEEIPIWVSDYVMMSYGSGAIMAVPAHDERDFEFAQKFDLPIKEVIEPITGEPQDNPEHRQSIVAIVQDLDNDRFLSINWGPDHGGHLFVGGGIDEGEDPVECAEREIQEETGYTDVEFIKKTGTIHHNYYAHSKDVARQIEATGLLFELKTQDQAERDLDLAEEDKFQVEWLPSNEVKDKVSDELHRLCYEMLVEGQNYTGEGYIKNSNQYNGLTSQEMRSRVVADLAEQDLAEATTNYRLQDWLISRQRYWGPPIPIVYCDECGTVPVPEEDLPVELPLDVSFESTGRSPLLQHEEFVHTTCPECGGEAHRETDTMDTFVDSSWYFLRYTDPNYEDGPFDPDLVADWLPVDHYIGGIEHAILHLLYARFITKVLRDHHQLEFGEPFLKLSNQGMIQGPDGHKMSKSRGNVINPDDVIESGYGADSFRMSLMFLGPYSQDSAFDNTAVAGMFRFLNRVWSLSQEYLDDGHAQPNQELVKAGNLGEFETQIAVSTHKTIKKVTEDLAGLQFNTALAALMEHTNKLYKVREDLAFEASPRVWRQYLEVLLLLMSPFAPHFAEELWDQFGFEESIHIQAWPEWNPEMLEDEMVEIVVQVDGKVRGDMTATKDIEEEELIELASQLENVARYLEEAEVARTVTVPNKLVNFVTE